MLYYLALLLLLASGYVQWRYHQDVLGRAFSRKRRRKVSSAPPVSVIVCFRNEEEMLPSCIDGILAQDYPEFELLLVNDNSTDGSPSIVNSYTDSRIRLLEPGPTRTGKKDALTYGIHHATHEILLLTDADCIPVSNQWIHRMTGQISAGAELALGVSPYGGDDRLLHRWQRFEATYTALQYLGYAYRKQPYMGVGRNLAYTKKFFSRAGGMKAHAHLPGGDDDLLVAGAARNERTKRVLDQHGWTISRPSDAWRTYFRRKLRHQSVGTAYPKVIRRKLLGLGLSHGLFYLASLLLLLFGNFGTCALALIFRLLLVLGTYGTEEARAMNGRSPGWQLLLFDAALAPFYLFLAVATLLAPKKW